MCAFNKTVINGSACSLLITGELSCCFLLLDLWLLVLLVITEREAMETRMWEGLEGCGFGARVMVKSVQSGGKRAM